MTPFKSLYPLRLDEVTEEEIDVAIERARAHGYQTNRERVRYNIALGKYLRCRDWQWPAPTASR